jgi:phenylpyruvate tautomerase PptA (4-oxalocrotonate tautomerase family)
MSIVEDGVSMLFGGEPGPVALVDVRSIGGLGPAVNGKLARRLGELVTAAAAVPGARTYVSFTDVAAHDWAQDGETFG